MSAALYESIGRKQAELEALHGEYDRLLGLLANVVEGRVQASAVRVDLQGRRWEVVLPFLATAPLENGAHIQGPGAVPQHESPPKAEPF